MSLKKICHEIVSMGFVYTHAHKLPICGKICHADSHEKKRAMCAHVYKSYTLNFMTISQTAMILGWYTCISYTQKLKTDVFERGFPFR